MPLLAPVTTACFPSSPSFKVLSLISEWRGACLAFAGKLLLADECLEVLDELVLDLDVPGALGDIHDEEQV